MDTAEEKDVRLDRPVDFHARVERVSARLAVLLHVRCRPNKATPVAKLWLTDYEWRVLVEHDCPSTIRTYSKRMADKLNLAIKQRLEEVEEERRLR